MPTNRDPFEAFVEKWSPTLRKAFLDSIAGIRDKASVAAISRQLSDGNVEGAVKALGLDVNAFMPVKVSITSIYGNYGVGITGGIPQARDAVGAIIKTVFDDRSQRASAWLNARSGGLIKDITEDQRAMIRRVMAEGIAAGKKTDAIALDLVGRIDKRTGKRTGGLIGLTDSQEEWQRKYSAEVASTDPIQLKKALGRGLRDKRFDRYINAAIEKGEPIPKEIRAKMIAAYRNASLEYRAKTIARTEIGRAMQASATEGWQQAIDAGQVAESDVRRFWRTRGDERVRVSHQSIPELNKGGRGWSEPFATPSGSSMHAPHDDDVGCRCSEEIRLVYVKKRAASNG